jgi:hypothetical protein
MLEHLQRFALRVLGNFPLELPLTTDLSQINLWIEIYALRKLNIYIVWQQSLIPITFSRYFVNINIPNHFSRSYHAKLGYRVPLKF